MKPLLATFLICSSVSLAIDDPSAGKTALHPPRPPSYALLEKVNAIEKNGPPEEMRRNISEAMKALMEADRSELMSAMNLLFKDGSKYWGMREMMVTQCLARSPEEPVFDLEKSFVQRMQASGDGRRWMPYSFAEARGAPWFEQEGVKAIERLGTLPEEKDLDRALFEGMCKSAKTVDEHLALLTWYVGPGRRVDRSEKGHYSLLEGVLTHAAGLDREKTRAWVELHFPPKTMRKSDSGVDWDITELRRALSFAWARNEPRGAIQWILAQYRDDDPDADWIYLSGVRSISEISEGGLKAGLVWLQPFHGKPHFIRTVAELLASASCERWDGSDLRVIGAWMSALPLATRESILIVSKNNYVRDRPRFVAKPDDRVLKLCCPNEKERATVVAHLLASSKESDIPVKDYWDDVVGHEFNLPARRMEMMSTPEALAAARRRMEQYAAVTTSLDPKERLDSLPVLDWLATGSTAALRETLQAHLENMHGELYDWLPSGRFAMKLIEAWTAKDWQGCEQFAWEAKMPADTRRRILIYCFQYAGERHPDEIRARIAGLISDGRMWSLALCVDGEDVQLGGSCFAGRIPIAVGRGLALNDPKAAAKLEALPPEWQPGALKGASRAFTKAEIGVSLLDWIVEQKARNPEARNDEFESINLFWHDRLEEHAMFERLIEIDLNAARGWLEAVPARLAPSAETFDDVYYVHQAMRRLDAGAADAWLHRVRPEATRERSK